MASDTKEYGVSEYGAEPGRPTLEQARANIEKMIGELEKKGITGIEYSHYPSYDDPHDHEYYFVLKREDPRHPDHTKMRVLITEGISMPGHPFEGDYVYGGLRKMYLSSSGGWLWCYARKHLAERLGPELV